MNSEQTLREAARLIRGVRDDVDVSRSRHKRYDKDGVHWATWSSGWVAAMMEALAICNDMARKAAEQQDGGET